MKVKKPSKFKSYKKFSNFYYYQTTIICLKDYYYKITLLLDILKQNEMR